MVDNNCPFCPQASLNTFPFILHCPWQLVCTNTITRTSEETDFWWLIPDEETMKVFLLLLSEIRSWAIWFIPYIAYGELLIQGLLKPWYRPWKDIQNPSRLVSHMNFHRPTMAFPSVLSLSAGEWLHISACASLLWYVGWLERQHRFIVATILCHIYR